MTDKAEHSHQFSIRERDGQASLWVGELNIWDIPKRHATPDVLDAICNAYRRGREGVIEELRDSPMSDSQWIDERND